ncbi:MAG: transporter substrate-binding domain-containing protein [Amaricoccus sp.]
MIRLPRMLLGLGATLLVLAAPAGAQEKLKIGTEAAYKPFAWVLPNGDLTGFDIDITKALCAEMKVECTIVNQAYDGLIPALNVKKIDAIIASMSITPEREKAIDFAGPYYLAPAMFIGPKGSDIAITPAGLSGKFVGVQRGTTMEKYVNANFSKATVQSYDTLEAAGLDLTSGRVDVVFADGIVLQDFLNSKDGAGFERLGEPIYDPEMLGIGAGIGIRKGDEALKTKFNDALKAVIASGEYAKINEKYVPGVSILPK